MSQRALTQETLDVLLSRLGPDPGQASAELVRIRTGVERLLELRGAEDPREVADRVIDHVASHLTRTQEPIHAEDKAVLFRFVARRALQEARRMKKCRRTASDEFQRRYAPDEGKELRLKRLREALGQLPDFDRRLILSYYEGDGRSGSPHRERLAKHIGSTLPTLRVRVHRIRQALLETLSAKEPP